ncbi:GTPase Era, putative [Plasmodium sp. DRC-Itaito]|nr:GTPase Era, putative [Plasmodium sp. DRC-Itaito]
MLKGIYLREHLCGQCKKNNYFRVKYFSILQRYIKARPHSNELKIKETDINENKKEKDSIKKRGESKYYAPNITRGIIPKCAYMNTWEIPEQPENAQFLKIALIGAPNAGKSSLLNSILNKTISAVSPKINTTKYDIKGIYSKDNVQLIFIDSPGIIPSHKKKKFCKELVTYAWKGYEEADLVLFIVDAVKRPTHDILNIVRILAPKNVEPYDSGSDDESFQNNNINDNRQNIMNKEAFNDVLYYNTQNIAYKNNTDNKTLDNKTSDNKTSDNKTSDNKTLDNKTSDNKTSDNKTSDNKTSDNKTSDNNNISQMKYDEMNREEKFIKYFSKEMEKDLQYYDKSIKENLFKSRKVIRNSYSDNIKNNITDDHNKEQEKINKKNDFIPPVILVLNKVDLCTHNKWANARAKEYMNNGIFDNIFFISAKYNKGIEELLNYIIKNKTKNQYWVYPKDAITTLSKVQIVEQLINTYIYCWFNKDVPYKIKHHMLSWCVNLDNSLIIEYQIIVKSEKVAKMICGIHNKLIINMRKNVSYKLTKLWNKNVYVHIHVKSIST